MEFSAPTGLVDLCRSAIRRAMRAIPDTESLYRCLMRVEHAAGNSLGVTRAFQELTLTLKELDVEPTTDSIRLFFHLADTRQTT
jgi:hypothetical protein